MNRDRYRLVFDPLRGMGVPVAETVCAPRRGRSAGRRLRRAGLLAALALPALPALGLDPAALPQGGVVLPGASGARPADIRLPVPLPTGGQRLDIHQSAQKAIIQWQSFDIGRASEVVFHHPGSNAATLNRVVQIGKEHRSVIEGSLRSLVSGTQQTGGAVYLINQNGILFGNGAQVNVGSLTASALDIDDAVFLGDNGHLGPGLQNKPAYQWKGDKTGFLETLVQVEPDAKLRAATGGSVMLFAPKVVNRGDLQTREGQVVLAAGAKVYLTVAPDPNANASSANYVYAGDSPYRGLAGLLVEVDPYRDADGAPTGGETVNDALGRILAARGNITLAGFTVNQMGRVTATTTVRHKGSVRLLARDGFGGGEKTRVLDTSTGKDSEFTVGTSATRPGELRLGADSVTQVLPEHPLGEAIARRHLPADAHLDDVLAALRLAGGKTATLAGDQLFNPSTVEGIGRRVILEDRARVVAPGGHVSFDARLDPVLGAQASRLYLGRDTRIDVAGLQGVPVDLARNFIEVLLTANDLADSTLNKDGFLYREKVWFDIRDLPDPRLANLSGYLKDVQRDVGEKLAAGGSIRLRSEGDLIQRAGGRLDVSGGSLTYGAGLHRETVLVDTAGNRYRLGDAPADRVYVGFADTHTETDVRYGVTATRVFHDLEAGYDEGLAAGSVTLTGRALVLDGDILAGVRPGPRQRQGVSLAGRLTIGDAEATAAGRAADFYTPAITLGAAHAPLAEAFTNSTALTDAQRQNLLLDSAMLEASRLGRLELYANGSIRVERGLRLAEGGAIRLTGLDIRVLDHLSVPGGSIDLTSQLTLNRADAATFDATGVWVAEGVHLDSAGLWTNDSLPGADLLAGVWTRGGQIALKSATGIRLGKGSVLDVSGGGWFDGARKLTKGDAGGIALRTNLDQASDERRYADLSLAGELRAFALGKGGSLTLSVPFLTLGEAGVGARGEFVAGSGFFVRGGFTAFDLTGRDGVLVRSGADLAITARNWLLQGDYALRPGGAALAGFTTLATLPADQRAATRLSLSAGSSVASGGPLPAGWLKMEAGSRLAVDTGGSLRLAASAEKARLLIDGTLEAPAGEIRLSMNGSLTNEGYDPGQVIWLGQHARLRAAGAARLSPNPQGLRLGTLLDGGRIVIDANKGYLVAERGAELDVRGLQATLDVPVTTAAGPGWRPTLLASNGGAIRLEAREGLLSEATFLAAAPGALGGELSVVLSRGSQGSPDAIAPPYPGSPGFEADRKWRIVLTQSGELLPAGLDPQAAALNLDAHAPGRARIALDAIQAGGFAEVGFIAEHGIEFAGPTRLTTARSIRLDAPEILAGGDVTLNTGHLRLANAEAGVRQSSLPNDYAPRLPSAGPWTWTAHAELIEVQGHVALSGLKHARFDAAGDIRLLGHALGNTRPAGSLASAGDLAFTARQVYPGGYSGFTLESQGTVSFTGRGGHDPVLTAGGELVVKAPQIRQGGVLKAPFGRIELAAGETLDLLPGSLTSVSAEGRVLPFGATERTGLDWLYDYGPAKAQFQAPPERAVALSGKGVHQFDGAVVDLSGSAAGDLVAFEWLPGTGGSADLLAESHLYPTQADGSLDKTAQAANLKAFGANTTGVWAILPADNAAWGHHDTQYYLDSPLEAGQAVYLSGLPDLPAGHYTLLPARYALLPGARLVTAVSGYTDLVAGPALARPDGAWLVSGHLAARVDGGWAATGRSGGFTVRDGAAVARLAEYQRTLGSDFFAEAAQRTGDAGRLSVTARRSMELAGTILAHHASGGRGADVDLAAPYLAALAPGKAAPFQDADGDGQNDFVLLDVTQLQRLNAASLMLGGTRTAGERGVAVRVTASQVRVDNDAEHALTAAELLLVAQDMVHVSATSVLRGAGEAGGAARDIEIGKLDDDGDGALLRLAAGGQAQVVRSRTDRDRGVLEVERGARLAADGSINLDASLDNRSAGDLQLAAGGGLALSASRISLGEPTGAGRVSDGLVLGQAELDDLARNLSGGELTLRSYSAIDLYGGVVLDSPGLNLNLEAGGLAGYDNDGHTARLTMARLTLGNPDGSVWSAATALNDGRVPSLGSGGLQVEAAELRTGAGALSVRGFGDVRLGARQRILAGAPGSGNRLDVADGALTLATPQVTAAGQAGQTFSAGGALTIDPHPAGAPPAPPPQTANARLTFQGKSVTHKGRVELPSGRIELTASGAGAADHLTLAAGSQTLAPGQSLAIFDQTVALPAGSVDLTAAAGDVVLEEAARIDLSGVAGGDAGRLTITAPQGQTRLAGLVQAANPADAQGRRGEGGRVTLDLGSAANLSAIAGVLADFNRQWQLRARTGSVTLDAGASIVSWHVLLAADAGRLAVRGAIDASGPDAGGRIELAARDDVVLEKIGGGGDQDGALLARAETAGSGLGTAGRGGVVVLDARDGRVRVGADTRIDVSGETRGGQVLLRAQRDGAGVRIDRIEGRIEGAREVVAEAVRVYEKVGGTTIASIGSGTSSGSKLGLSSVQADNAAYLAHAADIRTSLTQGTHLEGQATFHLRPGVEVRVPGSLTLSNDWDLHTWRDGGEPGYLTLRAGGNLAMNASLSDGFSSATASTGELLAGPSWSYRLLAGADTDAAHGLAVKAGQGDLSLASGKLVRTGIGDIQLAAGRDILFGATSSVVYTAGEAGPSLAGFTPPNENLKPVYPVNGGDLRLAAGRDIKGKNPATSKEENLNDWLYRAVATENKGKANLQASLWPRFDKFAHGVGALGGGDVTVEAARDVSDLWVSSAVNLRLGGDPDQAPAAKNLIRQGGGEVQVTAGNNLTNVLLFAGAGQASARAGGTATLRLALMEAGADVRADGNLDVKGVFNPTLKRIPVSNNVLSLSERIYFYSYGADSALTAASTTGRATLAGADHYPSTLAAQAPFGDVVLNNLTLVPAARGNLTVLAGGDARVNAILSDFDPLDLPTLLTPQYIGSQEPSGGLPKLGNYNGSLYHPEQALHAGDPNPVRVYALRDVRPGISTPAVFAKRAWIKAGGDVVDPNLVLQNVEAYDVSLIEALGSVRYAEPSRDNSGNINVANVGVTIAGPGRLHVVAGRDVDLGSSNGILSVGDAFNPFLPAQGATVMLWAGAAAGMDQAGFMAAYLEAAGATANRAALADYMQARTGVAGLDEAQALAAFQALPELDRTAFLVDTLYRELAASGRAALDPDDASFGDYSAGERALLRLFPDFDGAANLADQAGSIMDAFEALRGTPVSHPGDLKLFYSQVRSDRGGGIEILVPGGLVNAGLASATGINKPASQLGIVSVRGGAIRALARDDFLVNQSRVFTLGGDDILLWSALADIDAGRGAKTASATPPPVLRVKNGEIVLDYSGSVSGSGIAALLAVEGAEPGSVDLFAPYGEINAGEAGIRSAGDINLGARVVVGADLIVAGGVATGAPAGDAGGLGAALSGVSNLGEATQATDEATRAVGASAQDGDKNTQQARQALAAFRPSFLTVEVLGFGDGTASVEDEAERRRRQEEARLRERRG